MKYIANGFSPNMVEGNFTLHFQNITEQEFNNAILNGYSIIGHPEIAQEIGVKYNRETITLQDGDIMYLVSPKIRPSITEEGRYEHVPRKDGWTYRKITIIQKED